MKLLNTLFIILASTSLLANVANANTIEVAKAEPINHNELHAAVKLQLQDTMMQSNSVFSVKDLPINTLLEKNSQQGKEKTVNLANISYNAE
ncbi:hypothetical protein ACOYR1_05320 [Thalassotalea piscium]